MKVLVAGAGIGGLSAAIALKNEGHEVKCFDRVREMRPIGAAISGGSLFMPSSNLAWLIENGMLMLHAVRSEMNSFMHCSMVKWSQSTSIVWAGSHAVLWSNGPNVILEARHWRDTL